jgi:hypothetical protein
MYHRSCFVCCYCGDELTLATYRAHNGVFYCEKHSLEISAPKCDFCQQSVSGATLLAMNKFWHVDHFFCTKCLSPLCTYDTSSKVHYYIHDGKPYCQKDYGDLWADVCKGCHKTIFDRKAISMDSFWHESCLRCFECKKPFKDEIYYEIEGVPYCKEHFHKKRGTLCYECREPIMGSALEAMGSRFHPHHFNCKFCQVL